jgi:hypothetical protein
MAYGKSLDARESCSHLWWMRQPQLGSMRRTSVPLHQARWSLGSWGRHNAPMSTARLPTGRWLLGFFEFKTIGEGP